MISLCDILVIMLLSWQNPRGEWMGPRRQTVPLCTCLGQQSAAGGDAARKRIKVQCIGTQP